MKTIKSLVLGSAAALVAMSGAQAADLPVKAKAVEYVRICSLYGAGFFYIPGTDTCVKIGGYLRADLTINGSGAPFTAGSGAMHERYANYYNDYSRFALTLDTRTATEYGVVRTFGQADFTFGTEGLGSINQQSTLNTNAQQGNISSNYVGQGQLGVEYAFIQFAGFTFGKSASAYVTPWQGFPGNMTSGLVGGYDTVTGINNVQYTAQFGNGVSATIGVDDSSANDYNRTQLLNVASTNTASGTWGLYGAPSSNVTAVGTSYTGAYVPDFVGNIRVDQAWGLFQVSGALHYVDGTYFQNANTLGGQYGAVPGSVATNVGAMDSGHPDGKFGGAISAALQIKNLPTGPGDDFKIEGTWAKGATKYALGGSGALGGSYFFISNATGGPGSIVFGSISDGIFGGPGKSGIDLTTSWGVRGAFNHNWDPYWSSSLFGGIAGVSYDSAGKDLWCTAYFKATSNGGAGITTCDPGFTLAEVGVTTRWTPVKNLTFSNEIMYAQLDGNMRGAVTGTVTSAFPINAGTYNFKNQQGNVSVEFRAQRNF
ncbi:porin [Bradyrhizobium sp. dw_78]|uniref:porin n=1 Tax=Bradyrhizobium sp. dw_78 TaxID=2719793 RepID=UPI001BD23946|nr:porin [Bradyrhizobium sp. dw_78]